MSLILKICGSEWENASRDKRELSAYEDLGYEVAVLAKGRTDDKGRVEYIDGYKVYRYSTRPLGKHLPNLLNRVVSLISWAKFVRKIKPAIISGHDLMPGLTIGWISTIFNNDRAKLIYDSHEFELGRNIRRNKIQLYFIKKWEGFMLKKCSFSIVVNESIADEIIKIYHPEIPPIVLRSTPNFWNTDKGVCLKKRKEILSLFGENV